MTRRMDGDEEMPDHTEDPRKQDVGEGGYPETQEGGAGDDPTGGAGPARDAKKGGGERGGAPSPSTGKEADREHSTGNPGAAG
jgi:hypothetical protein